MLGNPNSKIIVALDVPDLEQAGKLVEEVAPHVAAFKVGMELCTAVGVPAAVQFIHERGGEVFLDLKFGDIPNTVAGAVAAAAKHMVWMCNVHANCGIKQMEAAAKNKGETLVVAVTVLTSIDDDESERLYGRKASEAADYFGRCAVSAGLDGVVCSADVAWDMLNLEDRPLLAVTPGIRPKWAAANDQSRIVTPADAVAYGSSYMVIGRPITAPPPTIGSPARAAALINDEISSVKVTL